MSLIIVVIARSEAEFNNKCNYKFYYICSWIRISRIIPRNCSCGLTPTNTLALANSPNPTLALALIRSQILAQPRKEK